jgi:hypothetical protein
MVSNGIPLGNVEPLANGEIVADLMDETLAQSSMGYEFQFNGEMFRWVIDGALSPSAIRRVGDPGKFGAPTYCLTQHMELDEQRGVLRLKGMVFGSHSAGPNSGGMEHRVHHPMAPDGTVVGAPHGDPLSWMPRCPPELPPLPASRNRSTAAADEGSEPGTMRGPA